MNKLPGFLLGLAALLVSCKTTPPTARKTPAAAEPKETELVRIGDESITPDAFFQSYTKNRFSADSAKALSAEEYFEVFKNTKLKLLDAKAQGRDTTSDYREEIASYREQLAAPYLMDKELVDDLVREAYNRLKQEVRAAHILVAVPRDAPPADTLSAHRAAVALRARLVEGEDFGKMAEQFSKDRTAAENGGDLGYFTAFQMVYPFETAAYETPVGRISEPVRTTYGYHLIKVLDRRSSRGKLRVAHILIQAKPDAPAEKRREAEKRIREAHARLQAGESWEELVRVYSDDFQSRPSAGLLPVFGVGEMDPAFEAAAFELARVGDYSEPVRTDYGWHIVRLVEKRPLESFATMEANLRQKVLTDSRGKLVRERFARQLRERYDINENPDAWSELLELADSTLVAGQWELPETFTAGIENPVLFTIEKEATSSEEFLEYTRNRLAPRPAGSDPKLVLRSYYNDLLTKRLLEYERDHLEENYPEFKVLMDDIREGVLLSQVMEERVWQRSLDDSLGQRRIYEENKELYRYPARAKALVVEASDTAVLNQATAALAEPPYPLRLKGTELLFDKGQTVPTSSQQSTLYELAAILKRSPDFVVEVAGYRTADEADTVSLARISRVVRYLNAQGIPITRITEKDYGSFRPVADPNRNRRTSFQFFSRSKEDLERAMNLETPGSVEIAEGYFARDHPYFARAAWQEGKQTVELPGGRVLAIDVSVIEPPRTKTFSEARGAVINAYQRRLEKQWLDSLEEKYPVQVNEAESKKLTR